MAYRVGADVGGTFTDILLISEETGESWRSKVPSTPDDQSVGVLRGIQKACAEAGVDISELSQILHGTTVATNALLEGKGARVGLITTRGFRQILQIARSYVPGGLAGWIVWPKPTPLAALENTIEVDGRVDSDGNVVRELNEGELKAGLEKLRNAGVSTICVSFINSYANPAHEQRAREIIEAEMPQAQISLSSEVIPEMREYERTLTTVANGYVQEQVSDYVGNLKKTLHKSSPQTTLALLRSDGGLTSPDTSIKQPVSLLMSGPAGGVTGATWAASAAKRGNFLAFDMGGTSTDVALVNNYDPKVTKDTKVGDLTIRASSVDVQTVGAGGGSIAHVPELTRALRVGPQSAGAVPGPAAYGNGGTEPTVTDANITLGYLPAELAGGEIETDVEAARKAVSSLQEALGLTTVEEAASGIIDIVNENILGAIRVVSVQRGHDPRDFGLVAFGGAGPLHGNAVGKLLGSWPVIIPPSPGVLNAFGDVMAGYREESSQTLIRSLDAVTSDQLAELFDELEHETSESLKQQGADVSSLQFEYKMDIRYHGQGFELPIQIDRGSLSDDSGITRIQHDFDTEHKRLFSFLLDSEHEMVSLTVVATEEPRRLPEITLETGSGDPSDALIKTTMIWAGGSQTEAGVYDRSRLRAGDIIDGPAIVSEMDSTALVLPDHFAEVDPSGCLLINPLRS